MSCALNLVSILGEGDDLEVCRGIDFLDLFCCELNKVWIRVIFLIYVHCQIDVECYVFNVPKLIDLAPFTTLFPVYLSN